MRQLARICIPVLLGLSLPLQAEQGAVDLTEDVSPDGFVSINVVRGEVRVEGWDRNEVQVRGTLDQETKQFIFDVSGSETRIEVRIPRSHGHWGGDGASDLTIRLPKSSRVDIAGVSTDVTASDLESEVEIGVVSGDIRLEGGRARIELQSVSGEVELRDTEGRIRVKSVSGDIESRNTAGPSVYGTVSGSIQVENGSDDLEVESVSGDIEVENASFVSVAGHSVSGDVEIMGELAEDGSVEFDNVSGSIRLVLSGDVDSRFDVETGSGRIRNRLSSDEPRVGRYTRDENLEFTLGEGSAEVILSTRSGDVTLQGR